jgi:hypothetical protein
LRLELDELRRLEGLAKRPRVQTLLANEIRNIEAKVAPFLHLFCFCHSLHFIVLPADLIQRLG